MSLIQYIALSGSLGFLCLVLYSVYRGKLREAYALIWILAAISMIVLSLSTFLLNLLAKILGIQTPAFALLLCLLGGMLLLLFQITLVISRHNEKINRLMQEITLLREKTDRNK